ncbi:MAG: aspartyl protease family protein [Caulobacteraceae bacterium]|nr:aspartyl protease family protein [Caulobacter sp.]
MREAWRRREALAAVGALACAGRAWAQGPSPIAPASDPLATTSLAQPSLDDLITLDLGEDDGRRLRVPARVDGRGPFPFLIDTGADHSVLSAELAHALALAPGGAITVAGIAGSRLSGSAAVQRLEVGDRKLENAQLALLARAHLGALGLVGLDLLKRERVVIDVAARRMRVTHSRGMEDGPGVVVVRGRSRFGQLILVDSSVRGRKVFVVLDSGAECTMGNPALRALLYRERIAKGRPDGRQLIDLLSVTGQTVKGESDHMPELTLGGLQLFDLPVVYADLDTFRRFGLVDQPALLLGMDVLRTFSEVAIDFGRREVGFTLA